MQIKNLDLRCAHCHRKLGVASGHYSITIKCHRCKGMTNWQAIAPQELRASSTFIEERANVCTNN